MNGPAADPIHYFYTEERGKANNAQAETTKSTAPGALRKMSNFCLTPMPADGRIAPSTRKTGVMARSK